MMILVLMVNCLWCIMVKGRFWRLMLLILIVKRLKMVLILMSLGGVDWFWSVLVLWV